MPVAALHDVESPLPPRPWTVGPADDRLPEFIGLSVDARAVLGDLKVLMVGLGSVGAPVADHVARLGVREIALVDPGRFKRNLGTQPILPEDVGRTKASRAAERVKAISPTTRARVFVGSVGQLSWPLLDGFDAICAATDNLTAEIAISSIGRALQIPVIIGAVHGETLTAQVRVILNRNDDGPCLLCGFGESEWNLLNTGEARFSCSPDGEPVHQSAPQPTMSISPLCSLAADLVTLQLVRLSLGLGPALTDCVLEYNGYRHATSITPLERNPRCRADHLRFSPATVTRPLDELTLRQCAAAAAMDDGGLHDASFAVGDLVFAELLACGQCGARPTLGRFVPRRDSTRRSCPACGAAALGVHQFHSFAQVPADRLGPAIDRPLKSLGADGAAWVTIRRGDRGGLVRSRSSRRRAR